MPTETRHLGQWTVGALFLVFLAPLVVYLFTFGASLSSEHDRWAEFGSAMAGIYAPILSIATLAVLLAQLGLQRQMHEHQRKIAYLTQARADIEFYAASLAKSLQDVSTPGYSFRQLLHDNFVSITPTQLDSDSLRALAANVDEAQPAILGSWHGVYPIIAGLSAALDPDFEMTLGSSRQKLISLLSFRTCVALDNLLRVRTEGKMTAPYAFSELADKRGAA